MQKPIESEIFIDDTSNILEGEVRLWKAVINQAFCDVKIDSDAKKEYKVLRRNAISWLTNNSDDFRIVCENANLNPIRVRDAALRVIMKLSKNLKK